MFRQKKGFTFIELAIVIAVVLLLGSLLLMVVRDVPPSTGTEDTWITIPIEDVDLMMGNGAVYPKVRSFDPVTEKKRTFWAYNKFKTELENAVGGTAEVKVNSSHRITAMRSN